MPAYRGKYFKLEQLSQIDVKRPRLGYYHDHSKLVNWGADSFLIEQLLQSKFITDRGSLCYYKLGQQLLQFGAANTNQGRFITNRGNYYKSVPNKSRDISSSLLLLAK